MSKLTKFTVAIVTLIISTQAHALTCMNKKFELQLNIDKKESKVSTIRIFNEAKKYIVYEENEIFQDEKHENTVRVIADRLGAPSFTYDKEQNTVTLSVGNPLNPMSGVLKNLIETKDRSILFENCKE